LIPICIYLRANSFHKYFWVEIVDVFPWIWVPLNSQNINDNTSIMGDFIAQYIARLNR
jgi:hypothetical protein